MIRVKWLYCISFIYLGLPCLIFCLTWLRLPINALVGLLIGWGIFRQLQSSFRDENREYVISSRQIIVMVLILGGWIFFSGIGGFAFQNPDFHYRNAVFRDLINYSWPVIYPPLQSSNIFSGSTQLMMVYYMGYWLPGALIGKCLGWGAANAFLFLWTWLGVILVVLLLASWLKKPPVLPALMLIFFSGMDILGASVVNAGSTLSYPVWPPTLHLEWWSGITQFSSFTTQLYWVFNQALPAWLCMAILVNGVDRKYILFLWSLCFFFAPLPALGMLPFVLIEIFTLHPSDSGYEIGGPSFHKTWRMYARIALHQIMATISPENLLGGGSLFAISYLYLSSNIGMQQSAWQHESPLFLLIFIAFECGLIWLLLLPLYRKKLRWYLLGGLLLILPMDFTGRVSIPALFLLMIGATEGLVRIRGIRRLLIVVCLVIGAVTPLYEINRSVYHTVEYYFSNEAKTEPVIPSSVPDEDQPYLLAADNIKSISNNCRLCLNFVGDTKASIFYKYLAKH